jgi:YD repeat-containing protein
VRRSVDLVLVDTIPIVFQRTYRNRDSRSRPFGIGTNHSFGSFLVGDAPALTYVDLIRPDGGRIHYERISGGVGHVGAVYEHRNTPSEYLGSLLSWNGDWTIAMKDGSVYTYPDCPPALNKPCTVSGYRDSNGRQIRLTHDRRMNLVRIEADHGSRIDLTYDTADRIILAYTSLGDDVRYRYDARGRLIAVNASNGMKATYAYDDQDQMIQIDEPGLSITNTFDDGGRCVVNDARETVSGPDGVETVRRYLFKFTYTLTAQGRITATEVERPTGIRRVTFNDQGYALSDTHTSRRGREGGEMYTRDGITKAVRWLTIRCGGPQGRNVEISIDPDLLPSQLRRQIAAACGGR